MQTDAAAWYAVDVQVGATLVSSILAVLTLLLWLESKWARLSTEKAMKQQAETVRSQLELSQKAAAAAEQSARMAEDSAKVTRQVFEQAKDQFIREHRSKLTVSTPSIRTLSNPTKTSRIEVRTTFVNRGKSNAKDLQIRQWLSQEVTAFFRRPSEKDGKEFLKLYRPLITIEGESSISQEIDYTPLAFQSVFLYGCATYTDSVTTKAWELEWCWQIADDKVAQHDSFNSNDI